jgi:hypothetical protein
MWLHINKREIVIPVFTQTFYRNTNFLYQNMYLNKIYLERGHLPKHNLQKLIMYNVMY